MQKTKRQFQSNVVRAKCVDAQSAIAQVLVAVDKIILQPSGEPLGAGWPVRRALRRVNYDDVEENVGRTWNI